MSPKEVIGGFHPLIAAYGCHWIPLVSIDEKDRARTDNLHIDSVMLYQLSYSSQLGSYATRSDAEGIQLNVFFG